MLNAQGCGASPHRGQGGRGSWWVPPAPFNGILCRPSLCWSRTAFVSRYGPFCRALYLLCAGYGAWCGCTAKITEHRVTAGGLVAWSSRRASGYTALRWRCWPVTVSRRFGCSTSRLREPTAKGARRRQRRSSRLLTLLSESGSGGGTDRLKSATGTHPPKFEKIQTATRGTSLAIAYPWWRLRRCEGPWPDATSASDPVAPSYFSISSALR